MPGARTVERFIEVFKEFEGLHEVPVDSNNIIFNRDYYGIPKPSWSAAHPGPPYCQAAEWDVAVKAGFTDEPKTASTIVRAEAYERAGRFFTDLNKIRRGDQLFFTFRGVRTMSAIEHTGTALSSYVNGSVKTIEANTSPTDAGDQRNGGGVYVKSRTGLVIVGFGRRNFDDAKDDAGKAGKIPRKEIGKGDSGHDVRLWQWLLNVVDKAGLKVDGEFGNATVAATKKWQAAHGGIPDGSVKTKTIAALEQRLAKL